MKMFEVSDARTTICVRVWDIHLGYSTCCTTTAQVLDPDCNQKLKLWWF